MNLSDDEFNMMRSFLLRETGIDVPEEKQYLFKTRLADLLQKEACNSFSEFLMRLSLGNESLIQTTIEAMTTHESGFYRDPSHFHTLAHCVLPALASRNLGSLSIPHPGIRILSAGCSFGQEPYSIAMSVQEWLLKHPKMSNLKITITGLDISKKALERARRGLYTNLELGHSLTDDARREYFTQKGEYWQLSDTIRNMVTFQHANLSRPVVGLGRFDIIFCRNMIIYFSAEKKHHILQQLQNSLEPHGLLFLGSTESLFGAKVGFKSRHDGKCVYYENIPASP